jgi:uncharacterized protein YdeI (YjbR/CyaY-like superfamily)
MSICCLIQARPHAAKNNILPDAIRLPCLARSPSRQSPRAARRLPQKGFRKPSITWPESVEAALCFGWIDGVRKSINETSYTIRFTPRKPTSTWSSININLVRDLTKKGLMHPAGLKAFAVRSVRKSGIYSYEQRKSARFTREQEKQFRRSKPAWDFFRSQAPWYQRVCTWWVISAKKEETKRKRLSELISHSQHRRKMPRLIPAKKK